MIFFAFISVLMQVLGDLLVWTVQTSDMSISCREVLQQTRSSHITWPCERYSHSAAAWREQTMVVSGGLGQEVLPLRDIWCFSLEQEKWSELQVTGMLPRYAHTSAVCGNQLILIGGVNTLPGNQPGVCVIDLNTASCTEYALPVSEVFHAGHRHCLPCLVEVRMPEEKSQLAVHQCEQNFTFP